MSKIATVKSLSGGEQQLSAVQKMTEFQECLQTLPDAMSQIQQLQSEIRSLPEHSTALADQTAQLASAITPIAQALAELLPLMQSIDSRLKVIESVLPRNGPNRPALTLAAQASVADIRKELDSMKQDGLLKGLLGQSSKKT